jgi:Flp pilus assembly protein CpaB
MSQKSADADNHPTPAQQALDGRAPAHNPGGSVRNRSNLLVLLGIAFFVVGGIIVYVVTNGDDGGSTPITAPGQITVVVATHDIAPGAKVDEEIKSGGIKAEAVDSGSLVAGAAQSTQQISGATFVSAFKKGEQILASGLQSVNRKYTLPEGFEAIAVNLNFVPGVAGYVNPGDRVNLYGQFTKVDPTSGATVENGENAHLVLTNVRVLDVNTTVPANGTTPDTSPSGVSNRASGDQVVFLLAVKTGDAEKLVYMEQGQALYASLVKDDAPPAGGTTGADASNILSGDPASSAG